MTAGRGTTLTTRRPSSFRGPASVRPAGPATASAATAALTAARATQAGGLRAARFIPGGTNGTIKTVTTATAARCPAARGVAAPTRPRSVQVKAWCQATAPAAGTVFRQAKAHTAPGPTTAARRSGREMRGQAGPSPAREATGALRATGGAQSTIAAGYASARGATRAIHGRASGRD